MKWDVFLRMEAFTLNTNKHKHLSQDDRSAIQEGLDRGLTFKAIAEFIGKDQTTVSKEVKKHLSITETEVKHFDSSGNLISTPACPKLLRAPFVCNNCDKRRRKCAFDKHLYHARFAHAEYKVLLAEAREGIPLNHQEFYDMDRIISEGIEKGQHLYHIMQTHALGVSKSTVYRHLKRGYLSVSSVDFPRVVKFKPRQKRVGQYVPKALKAGRTYTDFQNFIEREDIPSWVEMDTLIGRIGGKTILTMDFTFCNFMLAFLLPNKTAAAASQRIVKLKAHLAESGIRFGDIFPLILTDNGGEFADVFTIENDLDGCKETALFFCDPMQSSQKPRVEKNHTLFRDIVPKGSSFDHFTQETVSLIFSHVNSVKRRVLNGKTPYDIFSFTYGAETASILGITPIPADEVIQSSKLLNS